MWNVWKLESMPIAWISTSSPTRAVSVGVEPAYARPLKQWNVRSSPVTGGGSWWANSVYTRSGHFAPRGRTTIDPNSPRNVFSVWLGPWSWYGHAPTESGVHSHW